MGNKAGNANDVGREFKSLALLAWAWRWNAAEDPGRDTEFRLFSDNICCLLEYKYQRYLKGNAKC